MVSNAVFALVDCNNFFCSCERVFDPSLRDRPVVVLSNNDGCIVARSKEVKDLGVPMAAPYFKYRDFLARHKVRVFSSNYQLYGDMSNRVMSILAKFSPKIEFYSIDEAFLRLDGISDDDHEKYALTIRSTIKKYTDIPVSIGIGPSKTLAKIANNIAKKNSSNIASAMDATIRDQILKQTKIRDIWGIGAKLSEKFHSLNITTAHQLKNVDAKWARKYYTVNGEKIVRELGGLSCLDLSVFKPKQNIITSRSFGRYIKDKDSLKQIMATYASRACQKLRSQKSRAQALCIFIKTNKFRQFDGQYHQSITKGFDIPTNNTIAITKVALSALDEIFKPGYNYNKCGIILLDLISQDYHQPSLLFDSTTNSRQEGLMQVIDNINKIQGNNTLFFAAQGIDSSWKMKSDHCSPRYTTQWDEILQVS